MSIWRSWRVIYAFRKSQEGDLTDMRRNNLRLLQTSLLTRSPNWGNISRCFTENYSSEILCLQSVENVFNPSKASSGLSIYFKSFQSLFPWLEMNDKSDSDKILLKTKRDNLNMYVQMLGSRAEQKYDEANSCSEREVHILFQRRSSTGQKLDRAEAWHVPSLVSFALNTISLNEHLRVTTLIEKGVVLCIVFKDNTIKSKKVFCLLGLEKRL